MTAIASDEARFLRPSLINLEEPDLIIAQKKDFGANEENNN